MLLAKKSQKQLRQHSDQPKADLVRAKLKALQHQMLHLLSFSTSLTKAMHNLNWI